MVIVVVAGYATRPDTEALNERVVSDLMAAAQNLNLGEGDDILLGFAKVACSSNAEGCARLIRSAMTVQTQDFYVAREARIDFGEEPAFRCVGAFTQWTCWREE